MTLSPQHFNQLQASHMGFIPSLKREFHKTRLQSLIVDQCPKYDADGQLIFMKSHKRVFDDAARTQKLLRREDCPD